MLENIQVNEFITLVLGIIALIFIWVNRLELKGLAAWKILIVGFHVVLAGWILTNLESLFAEETFWSNFLNTLEHICYAGSSVLVAVWCFKVFGRKEVMQ
ncbi:MAG: hypothetical protein ACYS67_02395 [Planctomycetota bacterium]|jgi:hypothetical protein